MSCVLFNQLSDEQMSEMSNEFSTIFTLFNVTYDDKDFMDSLDLLFTKYPHYHFSNIIQVKMYVLDLNCDETKEFNNGDRLITIAYYRSLSMLQLFDYIKLQPKLVSKYNVPDKSVLDIMGDIVYDNRNFINSFPGIEPLMIDENITQYRCWEKDTQSEIIFRLTKLVEYFDDIFTLFDVKRISVETLLSWNIIRLVIYYNQLVTGLKNKILIQINNYQTAAHMNEMYRLIKERIIEEDNIDTFV